MPPGRAAPADSSAGELAGQCLRHGQAHSDNVFRRSHQNHGEPGTGGWLHLSLSNTVGEPDQPSPHPVPMKGFGLGLQFVKTVVNKHAGQIHLDLPPQPGATAHVHLKLPLVD